MENQLFELFNAKNVILYLIVINIMAFVLMWYDKSRARQGLWRVKEKTLLIISLAGGTIGALAGMYRFRHKTKHAAFKYGLPFMLTFQLLAVIAIKFRLYTYLFNVLNEAFKLE